MSKVTQKDTPSCRCNLCEKKKIIASTVRVSSMTTANRVVAPRAYTKKKGSAVYY